MCSGIENYSRHLDGRAPGQRPFTLLDYFPDDFLCVVDESHVTVPQLHGQYEGDRSRKETLVEHGFRLPSAMDNRPLRFDGVHRGGEPGGVPVGDAQPVRDRGVHPGRRADRAADRADRPRGGGAPDQGPDRRPRRRDPRPHRARSAGPRHHAHQEDGRGPHRLPHRAGRCACATSTARSTPSNGSRSCAALRLGEFDVLVGINLLREGLDLPEVSLVVDPRRRQGRLPAVGDVAHPDDRSRRAQRRRPGDHVRRPDDRLDAQGDLARPTAGARSSSSTTPSTASTRRRSARRSPTSSRCSGAPTASRRRRGTRSAGTGRARPLAALAVFDLSDVPPDELGRLIQTLAGRDARGGQGPALRRGGAPARRDPRSSSGSCAPPCSEPRDSRRTPRSARGGTGMTVDPDMIRRAAPRAPTSVVDPTRAALSPWCSDSVVARWY